MRRRLLTRLLAWGATVLLVHAAAFLLMRATRGGPFDEERALDPAVRASLEEAWGLQGSWLEQYGRSLAGLLRLDFGPSLRYRGLAVRDLLAQALPLSLALGGLALLVALLLGLPAGLAAAARRGRLPDRLLRLLSSLTLALPGFVLAGLGILLFSFHLGWLPPATAGGLRHLILPALSLGLPVAAQVARLSRQAAAEVLDSESVQAARARGVSGFLLLRRHVLPRASLPVVAFLGPAAAGLLTGSLVIEQVFALPGLGAFFVQGALNRDYPLVLGATVVYTALLGALSLAADLLLARLDPRVRSLG